MPTKAEIAWAAGLFEGEGCFHTARRTSRVNGYTYTAVALKLHMTDRDVVDRFVNIVGGGGSWYVRLPRKDNHKTLYCWTLGDAERIVEVIDLFLPWLCQRRTAAALEVRAAALTVQPYFSKRTHCPQGHPYDEENTYLFHGKKGVQRRCRTCQREASRRYATRAYWANPEKYRKEARERAAKKKAQAGAPEPSSYRVSPGSTS